MASVSENIGAPPGTLFYNGEVRTDRIKITLIEYNETDFFEEEFYDLSDCLSFVKPNMVKWINVEGLHRTDLVEEIGRIYNIHPLTMEDIVHVDQRPKFEDYEHYVVAIMKMISYDSKVNAEQLAIILCENTVISFQEPHNGDAFDIIRARLRQSKGRVRKLGPDYLAYALMDAVVDCYFMAIEMIGDKIEEIEEDIIDASDKKSLLQLYHLKREMIYLRKQVWPMRDMINNMIRSETTLINSTSDIYLRDLSDHVTRIIDTVETYRDLLSGIMDIYLSTNANKMNEVMKVLTIMSSIFIPVTFIAGVYGMNFDNMPELHTRNGYFITWGVMLTIIFGLMIYFKRKKWM
ncbi:MAG: magnesium transport protein CorA [Bacteroidetes bacterium]|jgi:magnesium transporter|nr:magnesium transport protein CorA [Bacteroidota bacterium]MDF2451468.1 magnesium transport protein CorA [Bacteroidota bacterium]